MWKTAESNLSINLIIYLKHPPPHHGISIRCQALGEGAHSYSFTSLDLLSGHLAVIWTLVLLDLLGYSSGTGWYVDDDTFPVELVYLGLFSWLKRRANLGTSVCWITLSALQLTMMWPELLMNDVRAGWTERHGQSHTTQLQQAWVQTKERLKEVHSALVW